MLLPYCAVVRYSMYELLTSFCCLQSLLLLRYRTIMGLPIYVYILKEDWSVCTRSYVASSGGSDYLLSLRVIATICVAASVLVDWPSDGVVDYSFALKCCEGVGNAVQKISLDYDGVLGEGLCETELCKCVNILKNTHYT